MHCIKWNVPSVVKELTCFNLNSTKWPTFARLQHQAVHVGPPQHGTLSSLPYIRASLPNYQHKFYAKRASSVALIAYPPYGTVSEYLLNKDGGPLPLLSHLPVRLGLRD